MDNMKNGPAFTAEMFKKFAEMKPKVDKKAIMESHKKNLEALNEASRMATKVMKSVAELQSQYVKKTFEDMNAMMKESMNANAKKNDLQKQTAQMQEQWQKAMEHGNDVSKVMTKHNQDMYKKMSKHFSDSMDNLRSMADKATAARSTKH